MSAGDLRMLRGRARQKISLPASTARRKVHVINGCLCLNSCIGDIIIPGGVTLSGNTLTCISTGGPATTVTWTRDSVTVTEGTETVLDDPVTAQYTHTLTVTSAGEYTCTVANNKPSTASAALILQGLHACTFFR